MAKSAPTPMPTGPYWAAFCVASGAGAVALAWSLGGGPPTQVGPQPNFRNNPTLQVFQKEGAEWLRSWYTQWEADWNVHTGLHFSKDHWEVPLGAVSVYLLGIYFGRAVMDTRKAFSLTIILALWNAFLALFSFLGAVRTVPELLYNLQHTSFESTICTEPQMAWGVGATGLWVQLFIFSKIPELLDTAFIVLRKRNVLFLHWYHHVTVLLYCWHAYATECGAGLYFVAMNYVVHAVMYAYYAAATLRIVPKWFPAFVITAMQISQMFVGMFICGSSIYYTTIRYNSAVPCSNDTTNLVLGGLMYVSYLVLFVQFAVTKYLSPAKPAGKKD